jgi:phosphate transport system substrate-binding protein
MKMAVALLRPRKLSYNRLLMRPSLVSLCQPLRQFAGLLAFLIMLTACSSAAPSASSASAAAPATTIQNIGSDTMVNLALAWAEAYAVQHPDIRISVTGGGSGTGLAALVNGTVDLANASRAINKDETAKAATNGIVPTEFVVARDAIAVIVNPENPVMQLSLPQLSKIYSGQITNWREVGGDDRPIVLLSRETNSGTHVYFLENVLRLGKKGDKTLFSPDTLLMSSSEGISAEVRQNPNAIGYDGLGYVTPDLKTVAVAKTDGGPYVMPSIATVNDKTYPIARDLYMYTRGVPTGAVKDYLDWIMATEAQKVVADLGFVPILK